MYQLLDQLRLQAGRYIGQGITETGQPFRALLEIQPVEQQEEILKSGYMATGRVCPGIGPALKLDYREALQGAAKLPEIEEHLLVGRDPEGLLRLWQFNLDGLEVFELREFEPYEQGKLWVSFGLNPSNSRVAPSDEYFFEFWPDGSVKYTYKWGQGAGEVLTHASPRMNRIG